MSVDININQVTESSLDGDGDFDKLMQTVTLHLGKEFEKGRITGVDYSNVYLGAMTQVLAQAIQFRLTKDQAAAQAELLDAQRLNVLDEISYRAKQKELLDEEIKLKAAQTQQTIKQTELLDEQILIAKQELLLKEKELELAEVQKELSKAQVEKIEQEIALLNQKTITETAQTVNPGGGLLGKQLELYSAQIQGFTNDDIQKRAKIKIDSQTAIFVSDPTLNQDMRPDYSGL